MTLAKFNWTDRARPIVEMGWGDTRAVAVGTAVWDVSRWDTPADTWTGTDPTWVDITCDTRSYTCAYGRQRVSDRFIVGTATVMVDNATGWADPVTVVDPFVLNVRPGRAIRMGVVHAVHGVQWLFRGFVDAVIPTYDPVERDTVQLDCIDALGEVNRAKFVPQALAPAGDSVNTRIARVLDLAQWPASKRDLQPTGDTLIADDLAGQAADLIGQAADSNGGAVFGDYEANIAYRPRDWQTYPPGTPIDGTIGNVDMDGTPEIPEIPPFITTDGYLSPMVGTVTTPDPGPLPATFTFVFDTVGPANANGTIFGQSENHATNRSWILQRLLSGNLNFVTYPTGAATPTVARANTVQSITGSRERLATAVTMNDAGAGRLTTWKDIGAGWVQVQTASAPAPFGTFDSSQVIRIGGTTNVSARFEGQIYSVELRSGLDPAAGTVLWRFDANDYPGTGTSYTDPRGHTWTLATAAAITPKVVDPGSPAVPAVPADVCPTRWERPFNRADIATRVIVARESDPASVVQLDDIDGRIMYGIEPFTRTDLLTEGYDLLELLARRILATRGHTTAPRVRSVSLDARTADNALDLMATVDVYDPSRYRCRLEYDRGLVFDGEYFATAVAHEVTPTSWTLELNLDSAEPFAVVGDRWDSAYWDTSLWAAPVRTTQEDAA